MDAKSSVSPFGALQRSKREIHETWRAAIQNIVIHIWQ